MEEGQLENTGDINLGIMASRFGDELHHAKSQAALQGTVDRLCRELSDRSQVPSPTKWSIPSQK